MSENTHVYIGTLQCGCHVAACVDMIDDTKSVAKAVQNMIKNGCSVNRVALADLRDGSVKLHSCVHEKQSEQGTLL